MTQILSNGKPISGGAHLRGGVSQTYQARRERAQLDPANKFLYANGRHAMAKAVGMSWPAHDDADYDVKEMAVIAAFDDAEKSGRFVDPEAAKRARSINAECLALCPLDSTAAPSHHAPAARPTPSRRTSSDGRRYEEISPLDRVKLKTTDRAEFDALRADWIARGQPFQVAT